MGEEELVVCRLSCAHAGGLVVVGDELQKAFCPSFKGRHVRSGQYSMILHSFVMKVCILEGQLYAVAKT